MRYLIFIFCIFPLFLGAEEKQPEPTPIKQDAENNSSTKKWEIDGIVYGSGNDLFSYSYGVNVGKYLNNDSLILLNLLGQTTYRGAYAFGLHYKKFLSKTFYIQAGVDQSQLVYSSDFYSYSFYSVVGRVNYSANVTQATFAIGNQWYWDNFTLGCSWIGTIQNLSSTVFNESFTGSGTASDISSFKNYRDERLRAPMAQVLRFYIGYTF